MLDSANIIKQRDPQDVLGFISRQPGQLAYDFGIDTVHFAGRHIENVVFAGMGGSALVAELAMNWPLLDVPFVIWKQYDLPTFVNRNTLVICSSYSGNTEETLSALDQAKRRGAQVAIIADGGELLEIAKKEGYIFAQIPECPQPRLAVFYAYRALVEILIAAKLAPNHDVADLAHLAASLEAACAKWSPDVPEAENEAKQLATHLAGKTLIVYGGPITYPAAYKWKISANENAKNTAWAGRYPEFNHNEMMGWVSHPVEKPFAVIDLLSDYEHPRVQKRFAITDRLLSGMRPKAMQIKGAGGSALEQMLYLVLLGDYVTAYLAILNGVNPAPVALVEKFKKELG
jgi:glucose/mannose-6-phosphate isomerase